MSIFEYDKDEEERKLRKAEYEIGKQLEYRSELKKNEKILKKNEKTLKKSEPEQMRWKKNYAI